jgi:hypothetical protein
MSSDLNIDAVKDMVDSAIEEFKILYPNSYEIDFEKHRTQTKAVIANYAIKLSLLGAAMINKDLEENRKAGEEILLQAIDNHFKSPNGGFKETILIGLIESRWISRMLNELRINPKPLNENISITSKLLNHFSRIELIRNENNTLGIKPFDKKQEWEVFSDELNKLDESFLNELNVKVLSEKFKVVFKVMEERFEELRKMEVWFLKQHNRKIAGKDFFYYINIEYSLATNLQLVNFKLGEELEITEEFVREFVSLMNFRKNYAYQVIERIEKIIKATLNNSEIDLSMVLNSNIDIYINWVLTSKAISREEKKKQALSFLGAREKNFKNLRQVIDEVFFKTTYWREPSEKEKEAFPLWRKMSYEQELNFLNFIMEGNPLAFDLIRKKETERVSSNIQKLYPKAFNEMFTRYLPKDFYNVASLAGKIDYLKYLYINERTTPISKPNASETKLFPDYLLHGKREQLAEKIRREFATEKGKGIRLLVEALQSNTPTLLNIENRQRKAIYTAIEAYFNRNIGTYQSVFGYALNSTKDKPDFDSIKQKLSFVLKSIT